MRNFFRALSVMAALGTFAATQAEAQNFNGYREIKGGNFAAAEQVLVNQLRDFPRDADLSINLAAVYLHQGRFSEARALYLSVLTRPDDLLDMDASHSIWSHDAATAGLARINQMQVTAR